MGAVGTGAGVVGTGAGCAVCVGAGGMGGMDAGACADAEGADAGCVSVSSELLGKHAFTINFGRTRPCLTSQIGVKIIST